MKKTSKRIVPVDADEIAEVYEYKKQFINASDALLGFAKRLSIENPHTLTLAQLNNKISQFTDNKLLEIIQREYDEAIMDQANVNGK